LLSCFLSFVQNVFGEPDVVDEVSQAPEKGRFNRANVFGYKPKGCSVVYSADAKSMASTWKSLDFKLINDVYTTGPYLVNKIYSAESPVIHIPSVSNNDRLFISLEEMFEVESNYDYVSIDVTTDNGSAWHRIYGKSGYTEGIVLDYLDVSYLSGKDVIFKLGLKSDDSHTGGGLSLKNFEVLKYERYTKKKNEKSVLRAEETDPSEVEVKADKLKIINVQWEGENEGVISFSAYNGTEFVPEIKIEDVNVVIKKDGDIVRTIKGSDGCLSFDTDRSQNKVDIVLVVDYSSSMSNQINNLRNSVLDLCFSLGNSYDARFALLQYGVTNMTSLDPFNPNVTYVKSFTDYKDTESFWCKYKDQFFYDYKTLSDIFQLCTNGGHERAYQAICEAANLNKFKNDAAKIIILLLDYDNDTNPLANESNIRISDDELLEHTKGFQLFAITDNDASNVPKYLESFNNICNVTGGYHASNSFTVGSDTYIDLPVDGDLIKCNPDNNYVSVCPNPLLESEQCQNVQKKSCDENFAKVNINSLYCANLHSYIHPQTPNTVFSDIEKKIGDNLKNRHYLRILPNCFSNDSSLKCGEDYDISIEIGKASDSTNTKYVYPGAIVRSAETKKYDDTCLEGDLPIVFSIKGGCDNNKYGNAKVTYMYSDYADSIYVIYNIKPENGVYNRTIPLNGKKGIKYRIEVPQDGGNDVVFPSQYSFLDGYWNVNACGGVGQSPTINSEVICASDTIQRINVSIEIQNPKKDGSVHLFFKKTNNDTLSSVFDHKELNSNDGKTYSFDSLTVDNKNFLDYYVLYVDSVSKSIVAHQGNGMDSINRINIQDLRCMDICHNISLSSHILTEKNDTLQFDVYDKETKAEIFLCDTAGKKLLNKEFSISSTEEIKKISLISELGLREDKYNLKYVVPYILVLKIEDKVHYMYVYLGRKK
ncbi:MAG TPA: VWA domain-containing protein, partial [Paludibacteraceae bacterium]|nr:VWA domain-containing protein [Paludibacteraceae bacterium]